MGDIYAAAQLTIIAAAGDDPTYGLPGVLSRPRLVPKAEKIGTIWLKPLPRLVQLAEVAESKWASRAWTFQEFYRSRRRLIFTQNQMIFMCNSQTKYEIALSGTKWNASSDQPIEDSYWAQRWLPHCGAAKGQSRFWTTIDRAAGHLQAYSNRHLSYDSDSLDAISGALDPLRQESVYHIWGALFRYATEHSGDSNPERRSAYTYDTCSACMEERLSMRGYPRSTIKDRNYPERINVSGSQIPRDMERSSIDQESSQYARIGFPQQIEMALSWYHKTRGRRRLGFPSWSSLGWEGPLSWHRSSAYHVHSNSYDERSPIILTHVCRARLHFPRFVCDLASFNPTHQESLGSVPPTIEITLRTAKLELLPDGEQSRVAMEMSADYRYAFKLDWDVDPTSLGTKELVGALLYSKVGKEFKASILVLAVYGEVLERVGLVQPLELRYHLWGSYLRRRDFKLLTGERERVEGEEFLKTYSSKHGIGCQSLFGDYRPVVIG